MTEPIINADTVTSHEQDGRVLSGVGVSADRLAETMDRHAPPDPPPAETTAASTEPPADAPVSRGRQRFADLTRERDEARAEAATAKAEAVAAKAAREALPPPVARVAEPVAEPSKLAEVKPTRPEPTEDEIGTKYETYAAFTRDLARWVVEQDRAAQSGTAEQQVRELLARERSHAAFGAAVQSSQDRGRKAYPDFDALLNSPAGQVPLGRTRDESIERVAFLANHPQSEHIQYAILKDAALATCLRDSDPYSFGVLIAGLVPAAKPAAPAWTPPPPPAPVVSASSTTTGKASGEMAKGGYDFDKSGYREKRAAERGVKPKRW